MQVATDPKLDQTEDSDDGFGAAFEEYAAKRDGLAPNETDQDEPAASEGNDPEEAQPAPEEDKPSDATDKAEPSETVTSDEAEPEGDGQSPKDQAPDPFADLPQDVRDRIKAIEKERDDAKHRASSDANRVAALSRKLNELKSSPASAVAPAPEKTEAQKALDDKITQLKEDYGDIAEPLIELIEAQASELSTVRTVLTGLSEERQQQVIAAETQALEARHPDFREIAKSDEFKDWLQVQPQNIQGLATSWDARETSVVLTLFKAERLEATGQTDTTATAATDQKVDAATGKRRSQQLDGGRDVRSRPAPAASEAPEDFDAAFKFYEAKRQAKEAALRR